MEPITVTSIKTHSFSEDGAEMTVSFETRFAGGVTLTMPTRLLDELRPSKAAAAKPAVAATAPSGQLHMPKKWMLAVDVKKQGIIVLVFDPRTDKEAGVALRPAAAKKLAAGLVQNADRILAHKPPK